MRKIKIFDGAYGTELSKLPQAQEHLVEELNIIAPEVVVNLHKDYIDAGADYLTTNSLSVNPAKWESEVFGWKDIEIGRASCRERV